MTAPHAAEAVEPVINTDFEHCESVYWVFTQRCNDECDHCYNLSGPRGAVISLEECLAIVDHLPARCDRIILSGGEPLADRKKLYAILEALRKRYGQATQVMLQTNGDLLTPERLDRILELGVSRIDIASIDRYHKHQGHRRQELEDLFRSRGMRGDEQDPLIDKDNYLKSEASFGFWGATEDMWLGGNWARGRALEKDIWKRDGGHNFCAILSGARGFLGGTELPQEISIQLWRINPCCPGTHRPLGDARTERVADVLAQAAASPVWRALNRGNPYAMGAALGLDASFGRRRAEALQNVCLWCDEFFSQHHNDASSVQGPIEV
ncbi:Radical SAM protein [Sulfidibacter corallicola]|uniref:Radical SAM protein n=1 Tax=Sulfidibacter corallicola TaxID=2818388 RepID=A0A8A4TSZ0_SULCO|nr:radical SAM protein [Sulfidibacter corallicola]QTD52650.1 radical SAM protein [Sulfidibacter corallicola]